MPSDGPSGRQKTNRCCDPIVEYRVDLGLIAFAQATVVPVRCPDVVRHLGVAHARIERQDPLP
jgi:hypothetical protein